MVHMRRSRLSSTKVQAQSSCKPSEHAGALADYVALQVYGVSGLGMLASSRPIDRLRYQAKLVFDHFDQDRDG